MNTYHTTRRALLCASVLAMAACGAHAQSESATLKEGLGIPTVGRYGRGAVHTDAVEARIVAGEWRFPAAGDTVALPDGRSATWTRIEANNDGVFSGPAMRGGYAAFQVDSPAPAIRLLETSGPSMVYVNGEPRTGDIYGTGWTVLPIALRTGANTLLFQGGRGTLTAKLTAPKSAAVFNTRDLTLPDIVSGEAADTWGAVIVINASERSLTGHTIRCAGHGLAETVTPIPAIPPLSLRKVGFRIRSESLSTPGAMEATLTLAGRAGGDALDSAQIGLRVRRPNETRKITFISGIDGSVQYYALNPVQGGPDRMLHPALVLSLHGASVEAIGQADAYAGKSWMALAAPTNRRPYGFDWEDWGRLDALEVLALAKQQVKPDPRRIYLTGHSMGGHGTWHLGATYPDLFAAIGPSAGWISLFSYAGAGRADSTDPVQALLQRPMQPSDTLSLIQNYAWEGVYILHGDADDNVPVTEAREMKRRLAVFHPDVAGWEQPGAGHWWSIDQKAKDERYGAACVDWQPMLAFFAARSLPLEADVRKIDFVTADPGVSAWCHWAGILAQEKALADSTIHLAVSSTDRKITGTTVNVYRLALKPGPFDGAQPIELNLDGDSLGQMKPPTAAHELVVVRRDGHWKREVRESAVEKNPERCGPFKQAFRNRMVMVYGTRGSVEENAWSFARARFDAENFWYRGNGAPDVVSDREFRPDQDRQRSVILYGNSETNGAWAGLLKASPVTVSRAGVRIDGRAIDGADIACLFVRPRPGSAKALVAVVGGTGIVGMRLTDRLPYFGSGVEYPDCIVLRPDMLQHGAAGVVGAGFFGNDWSVAHGEFAWHEASLGQATRAAAAAPGAPARP